MISDSRGCLNSWTLVGARVACGPDSAERRDIEICSGRIVSIGRCAGKQSVHSIDLTGCLILPGLINAHDHLELNLFKRLGHGPYPNAAAWARDIYRPGESPIKEHLEIPLDVRLSWGAVKNALSGVTTVCHHNPFPSGRFGNKFPVKVIERLGWAHSLEFTPDVSCRFEATPHDQPFVIHLAESVDRGGRGELRRLQEIGALDDRTVLVHAVGLGRRDLALARRKGASIIWCPRSNIFILGRTLDRATLESGIPVALGTDSALSSTGGLLEEIRYARQLGLVSVSRLYEMVTAEAARVLKLDAGEGSVVPGGVADLLIIPDHGVSPATAVQRTYMGKINLILRQGTVTLASSELVKRLPGRVCRSLSPIVVGGNGAGSPVYIAADVQRLFQESEPQIGTIALAGKRIRRPLHANSFRPTNIAPHAHRAPPRRR